MNKSFCILFFSSCLLAACSSRYASNGETQYLHSQNGPNIVIQSPLASDSISHFYDLPQPSQSPNVSIAPPSTASDS